MEEENAALKLENEQLRQEIEILEDQIIQLEKKQKENYYSIDTRSIQAAKSFHLDYESLVKKLK
jgi:regulator of replication initiation timing